MYCQIFKATFVILISLNIVGQLCAQDANELEEGPSADLILRNYFLAIGGEEVTTPVKSMKITCEQEFFVKQKNKEKRSKWVDTILVSGKKWIRKGSDGKKAGFDGTRSWAKSLKGKAIARDETRYDIETWNPISYPKHVKDFPGKLTFDQKTEVNDRPAYRVAVKPNAKTPDGRIQMSPIAFIFDVKSKLLVQVEYKWMVESYSDYREVSGIMIPFVRESNVNLDFISSESKTVFKSIELNVEIDESEFVIPID